MSHETNTSTMSDNIWYQAYLNDWMGWWKQKWMDAQVDPSQ